jgi:branched-chain amino acid aminotransferase
MSLLFSRLKRRVLSEVPKLPSDLSTLKFGQTFAPHMLVCDWTRSKGWTNIEITPLERLSIHPASSCLHYGVECFEGLKAFKGPKGEVRLFRPDKNIARLKSSLSRLELPDDFDSKELEKMIKELAYIDRSSVPDKEGFSLYIRPAVIGMHEALGVAPSDACKLFVISSPVGPYYPSGFKPVNLLAEKTAVRAWPGGTGAYKLGANYAIALGPQTQAQKKGFSQVLWLFGPDDELTEVGTMNLFVVFGNPKTGEVAEIVTPPLTDGMILPGVTRDSAVELCQSWYKGKMSERKCTMKEVASAAKAGKLLEVFGLGTAAVVSPVKSINYNGEDVKVPLLHEGTMGPLAKRLWDSLTAIQYGKVPSPWSVACTGES